MDQGVCSVQKGSISGQGTSRILEGIDSSANLRSDHIPVITPLLYRVQAKPIEPALPEFYRLLTDGTIARQEPDGEEIIASMQRAIFKNGIAEWTETCYCSPPLRHERATIYDRFFTDMRIEPASSISDQGKRSFWAYLGSESLQPDVAEVSTFSGSMTRALGRNTV